MIISKYLHMVPLNISASQTKLCISTKKSKLVRNPALVFRWKWNPWFNVIKQIKRTSHSLQLSRTFPES